MGLSPCSARKRSRIRGALLAYPVPVIRRTSSSRTGDKGRVDGPGFGPARADGHLLAV